jgi:signal transduction histidine kinase
VFDKIKLILDTLGPQSTLIVTLMTLVVMFAVGWARQYSKHLALGQERDVLYAVAQKGREILASAPDGLFLWDHVLGGVTVSRRLAVLLGLKDGTHSRYDDIRTCFKGESLKALERACSALRGNGTPFDLVLINGDRLIQTIGQRAENNLGEVQADLVWMRDVSELTMSRGSSELTPYNKTGVPDATKADTFDDRHLTALLDAMPIPVWLRDSKLNLAFVNRAATGVVDAKPDLAKHAWALGERASERRLIDRDGTAQLVELSEIPLGIQINDENKKSSGTLGYALDQSEREEMESAFMRHRLSYDAVLEGLPAPVAIFTADTHLEFANSAYADLWKMDRHWLSDRPSLADILEKQHEDRLLPEAPDFRAFKAEQVARFRILRDSYTEMLYLPSGQALRQKIAPYGDGGLVYTFDDISDNLDLQRSYKELGAVQSETLDNLHEGVAVFGSDGRLKLYNPVYANLWELDDAILGAKPHLSEILERTRALMPAPDNSTVWLDEDWAKKKALIAAQLLSRGQSDGRLNLTNGKAIKYVNVPLPDGAVLLSYVDISDSAKIESALRDRAEAMEQADQVKSEFIADVSREVRTPLNTVIGFADMLSQEYFGDLNPRQSEYAQSISETGRNIMSVVSDVLDLANMDAGRLELNNESIDIHGLLVSSFNLIKDRAKRRSINLEFDCAPDIGWMTGDTGRLKQVIYNLMANAATYTPPRGKITLGAAREKDQVVIRVIDTGVGIPNSDKQRIFRPFDKGGGASPANDETKPHILGKDGERGVGLGLTIAKRFIERHGGTIDVKSLVGRGTTVDIKFPGIEHTNIE